MSRATQDTTTLRPSVVYGTVTPYGRPFQGVPLDGFLAMSWSYNPVTASTATVWATPLSLATTRGIILIFSSYGYLDVSVPHVRPGIAGDGPPARRVAPFGHPRIKGYLLLPVAFRSLSRPSSPPRAKASTVCPCLLSARRTSPCGLIYLKLALLVFSTRLSTLDVQHVKDLFLVENNGFEPLTLCLQSRCSSQLS